MLQFLSEERQRDLASYHFMRGIFAREGVPVRDLDDAVARVAANQRPAAQTVRAAYWTLDDIAALEPPEWLIDGLMPRRGKILIFGESGHYKTMHAVDQLCRLAHGMDYHGLAIPASYPVVFLANEDAYGLAVHRLQGWHLIMASHPAA